MEAAGTRKEDRDDSHAGVDRGIVPFTAVVCVVLTQPQASERLQGGGESRAEF